MKILLLLLSLTGCAVGPAYPNYYGTSPRIIVDPFVSPYNSYGYRNYSYPTYQNYGYGHHHWH